VTEDWVVNERDWKGKAKKNTREVRAKHLNGYEAGVAVY
jgi:hypothetical protein